MSVRLLVVDARSQKDAAALGRFIADRSPHVVCVQHAPHRLRWRSLCGRLARLSGLVVVSGGRAAGANLILSTLGVDVVQTWDTKVGAVARLSLSGVEFAVAATSLDADELTSSTSLKAALAVVEGLPVIRTGRSETVLADDGIEITRGEERRGSDGGAVVVIVAVRPQPGDQQAAGDEHAAHPEQQ